MVRPWVVQLDYPDPRLLEPGHPLHSLRRPEGRSVRSAGERLVPFYFESPCHLGLYAPCVSNRTLKGDAGDSCMKAMITFSSDFTQYYKFYEVTREYDPPKQGIHQEKLEYMRFRKVRIQFRKQAKEFKAAIKRMFPD